MNIVALKPISLDSVPLETAILCENCKMITHGSSGRCVCCGSESVISLAAVLDREDIYEVTKGADDAGKNN